VESLRLELLDRFGSLPAEVENLLDAAVLRLLGRSLGVDHILLREDSARVTFRHGFVPRMAVLEGPLRQRQAEVEIRRLEPLSIVLHQVGMDPILETLMVALEALRSAHSAAA
jgi:transcription-repair coupling factor (superfamily II helicase)